MRLKNSVEEMGVRRPKSARDVIPLRKIYSDGICFAGNSYSKVYKFSDINYTDLSEEGQEHIFREYMKILSGIDATARKKITICNHRRDMEKFRAETLYDSSDAIAKEINDIIESRIEASSCTEQDRYITISVTKKNITEARAYFERITSVLSGHLLPLVLKPMALMLQKDLRCIICSSGRKRQNHIHLILMI